MKINLPPFVSTEITGELEQRLRAGERERDERQIWFEQACKDHSITWTEHDRQRDRAEALEAELARLDPATVAALCNMALRSSGVEAKIVEQAAETMRAEVRLDEITGEPLWFCSEADGRGKISEHTFVELAAAAFAVGTIIRITEPRSVHQE